MSMTLNAPMNASEITAVIFDFGGVLAEEGFRKGLKEIARRENIDPEAFFDLAAEAVYQSGYVTGRGSEEDFWRLVEKRSGITIDFRACSELILKRFVLRPAMLQAVRHLKEGSRVVAILSDQTDWLDRLEQRDHFFDHFDRVFNSYHLGKGKRDPTLFDETLQALGVEPRQGLFIDDNAGHIERARSRRLHTILFRNPTQCLASLSDILSQPLSP